MMKADAAVRSPTMAHFIRRAHSMPLTSVSSSSMFPLVARVAFFCKQHVRNITNSRMISRETWRRFYRPFFGGANTRVVVAVPRAITESVSPPSQTPAVVHRWRVRAM